MTSVNILVIPHEAQRYETVGDWWWEGEGEESTLQLRVSQMGNWKMEMCVAYHELHEALECKARGITQKQVDDFDLSWEEHDGIDEPGNDPTAPYYWQHQHATAAEMHLANYLGLEWEAYASTISCL